MCGVGRPLALFHCFTHSFSLLPLSSFWYSVCVHFPSFVIAPPFVDAIAFRYYFFPSCSFAVRVSTDLPSSSLSAALAAPGLLVGPADVLHSCHSVLGL